MLSPPSIRCSPTAVRVSVGRPPGEGSTRISVRSVVPPPTSTTSTRWLSASLAASASPCSTSQSWNAALGSSSSCTAGRPASRAASSVSVRAPSSNDAGTVSTTACRCSGAPGWPASHAAFTCARYEADAASGETFSTPSGAPQGRMGAVRSTPGCDSQLLALATSRAGTAAPSSRAQRPMAAGASSVASSGGQGARQASPSSCGAAW